MWYDVHMTILDTIDACTIEPGDYVEVNGNTIIVEQVEDNGMVVLIYGLSTLTGDKEVEETYFDARIPLISEDDPE